MTAPLLISTLLDGLNRIAPFSLAESWDNVGLLVGRPDQKVRTVLIGLDPTLRLLDEAISLQAELLLTHHPIIFRPLRSVSTDTPAGTFLQKALAHEIAVIGCHTNLDNARDGVSDALARRIGLGETRPLLPGPEQTGLGRIGSLREPLAGQAFLDRLFQVLPLSALQIAGPLPARIKTVALCGGSGSELAETARSQGADCYLSAEIKHSTARWAEESGFCVIDATHYATEQPAVELLAEKLQELAASQGWQIHIVQTKQETHPFTTITQHNRRDAATRDRSEP